MKDRLLYFGDERYGSRRDFLAHTAKLAAVFSLGGLPGRRGDAIFRGQSYPFTLGVASGDPLPDGVILWTRLAPEPLAGGGMASDRVTVQWEVAGDDAFRSIVRSGSTVATPELAHGVHADVRGLEPDRPYWYRFMAGDDVSPVGRTHTAPAAGSRPARLRFAFASCQHYESGLYTAWSHMANEEIELVVHLGDYIYEGGISEDGVRRHDGPPIETLEAYRNRYALYKSDPNLQAAHAAFPFVVTWDDHEVVNNYAGPHARQSPSVDAFLERRAAAYQAYYEHMPLRDPAVPRGADLQLFRRIGYGNLVAFNVLDTRQYRTLQPCDDGWFADCPGARDPGQTMLGNEQREWLHNGLVASAHDGTCSRTRSRSRRPAGRAWTGSNRAWTSGRATSPSEIHCSV